MRRALAVLLLAAACSTQSPAAEPSGTPVPTPGAELLPCEEGLTQVLVSSSSLRRGWRAGVVAVRLRQSS